MPGGQKCKLTKQEEKSMRDYYIFTAMGVRQEVQSRPAMVVRGVGGGDLSVMPSYMVQW